MTQTPISEPSSVIDESCAIKSNYDYLFDSIEHHLNGAFVLHREVELHSHTCCNIDTTLASIEYGLSPNLGIVSKDVLHFKRGFESKWNRHVNYTVSERRNRLSADGWRLYDEEFDELNKLCSFTAERCCNSLGLNDHYKLLFYSGQNFLLEHELSGHQSVYCNPPWSLAIKCV